MLKTSTPGSGDVRHINLTREPQFVDVGGERVELGSDLQGDLEGSIGSILGGRGSVLETLNAGVNITERNGNKIAVCRTVLTVNVIIPQSMDGDVTASIIMNWLRGVVNGQKPRPEISQLANVVIHHPEMTGAKAA